MTIFLLGTACCDHQPPFCEHCDGCIACLLSEITPAFLLRRRNRNVSGFIAVIPIHNKELILFLGLFDLTGIIHLIKSVYTACNHLILQLQGLLVICVIEHTSIFPYDNGHNYH